MSNDMNPAQRLHYNDLIAQAGLNGEEYCDLLTSCHEPISPLLVPINRLLKQRDDLASLCGEMLATLRLPQNEQPLTELSVSYNKILELWWKRYAEYSGNPNSEVKP